MGRRWWAAPSIHHMVGRGPARPIKFFIWWAAARPGPSNLRGWAAARPSPSRFKKFTARARPAHQCFKQSRPGPAHDIGNQAMRHGLHRGRPVIPVGRTMCGPVLEFARICAHVFFNY